MLFSLYFTAVSYTHLDVYKRQVYGTIELAAEAKDEVSDDNSKPGTDDPSTGNTEKPGTGKPAINNCLLYTSYGIKDSEQIEWFKKGDNESWTSCRHRFVNLMCGIQ